ncbi:MAG: response regulator transcription factor, partial [Elusimicrobiota bacterium]|nr:response regulator transcription factor [Elusimicrobiota bacterium]
SPEKIQQEISNFKPLLIIIDLDLNEVSGLELLRIFKQDRFISLIPKLVISGKFTQPTHMIHALNDFEIDDYSLKPISAEILLAKISSLLRRYRKSRISEPKKDIIRYGNLKIDVPKISVSINSKEVRLTNMEFKLLFALMENKDCPLSRDNLLEKVFEYRELGIQTRTVDKHIQLLRKKLGCYGKRIVTVTGIGYKFVTKPTKYYL